MTAIPSASRRDGKFLWRVNRLTLRNKVRNWEIRKAVNFGPLQIARSQIRWFGHMITMPTSDWRGNSSWLHPQEHWPFHRPSTRRSDYISDLAWSSHGVEPAELSEIGVDRGVFRVVGQLPRDPPQSKSENKNKWMIIFFRNGGLRLSD